MGTAGYMSPEQVRGLAADARSDIFTFGAVLYEMTSGQRAFQRETAAETMTAILKDDPPPFPADTAAPPALDHLIRHCLEKRPDDRFRSAADLAFQLETLTGSTGRVDAIASAEARPRRRIHLPGAAALFLSGLVLGWIAPARWMPFGQTTQNAVTRSSVMTYSGLDFSPATSPDGRTLAFVSRRDGVSSIWLRQIATGEEAALTRGTSPRFSPDGATMLLTRADGRTPSLYQIPTIGGQPRKLLEQAVEGDWSPDGSQLAFVRLHASGEWVVGVAGADGSHPRESPTALTTPLSAPRWSPDNRAFVVVQSGANTSSPDRILKYDAATLASSPIEPIEAGGEISAAACSGNGALVYAQSPDVPSQQPQSRIVLQRLSGGGRALAWVPAHSAGGLDVLGDATVVMDTESRRQNLVESEWTPAGLTAERWLTRGTQIDRQPIYTPDGGWIAFTASRNGNLDLWMTSRTTGETRRLTDDRAQDADPGFTRDGRSLLWSSNRSGHFEIWIAEADGRNARQLTQDGIDAENPTTTTGDEWIVYASGGEATQGIWKIRRDGSQATRIVTGGGAVHPDVSPDGEYVLFHSIATGTSRVSVVRVSDGQPAIPTIDVAGRGRWRPDGRAIVYLAPGPDGPCLYEQAFVPGQDTTSTRRVLQKSENGRVVESFAFSPDGKHLTTSFIDPQLALMRLDGLIAITRPRRK